MRIYRSAEGTPFHSTAREARRNRRERLPVGRELCRVALPERILPLPANGEIVTDPEVALAVEHRLATRNIPAARELERKYPGTGNPVEVGHVRD